MSVSSSSDATVMSSLEQALGHQFGDSQLFELALTHRSAAGKNNERLEFLGDSLLNFLIAERLFEQFPDAPEGDLSRLRALLVKGQTLAEIARELELGDKLMLGSGERKSGGHRRQSILADTLEALFGAIYLDGGMTALRPVVGRLYEQRLKTLPPMDALKDPKTRLQEHLQGIGQSRPDYELIEVTGASHQQSFKVQCKVDGHSPIQGQGRSRRAAEQQAAEAMLEQLSDQA